MYVKKVKRPSLLKTELRINKDFITNLKPKFN